MLVTATLLLGAFESALRGKAPGDWVPAVVLALAAFVLVRNLPSALLCLWPGFMRTRLLSGAAAAPRGAAGATAEELEALGFARLGLRREGPPLGRSATWIDFALPAEKIFASVRTTGYEPQAFMLSTFQGGAVVLTADHRRPGSEREGAYLAGGIPGATAEQLLAVHRKRVERMAQAGRVASGDMTAQGRLEAARQFYRRAAARELRLANANGLLLTACALFILARLALGQGAPPQSRPPSHLEPVHLEKKR